MSQPFQLKGRQPQEPTTEELLAELNRSLPFSDDAEKGVLSGVLDKPERLLKARALAPPEAFYHAANRLVWETILAITDANQPLDVTTLTSTLRDKFLLDKIGGPGAIADLYSYMPISVSWDFSCKTLMDKWKLRKAAHAYALGLRDIFDHGREHIDKPADTTLSTGLQRITEATGDLVSRGKVQTVQDCILEHVDYIGELDQGIRTMLRTGIPSLDAKWAGFANDEHVLITGETKGGKTTLAQQLFTQTCQDGKRPAYFSAEVGTRTLGGRFIYAQGFADASMDRFGTRSSRNTSDQYAQGVKAAQQSLGIVWGGWEDDPAIHTQNTPANRANIRGTASRAKPLAAVLG